MPVTYEGLIKRGETIYNKVTGVGYKDPTALATDLGIQPHQIDWTKIQEEGAAPTPTPTPTPIPTSPKAPVAPVTHETPPGTVVGTPPASVPAA